MKTIITTLVLLITSYLITAQTEIKSLNQGTTITVSVKVPSEEGKIIYALQDENTFMTSGLDSKEGKIVNGTSTVIFEDIKPGEYAVILFHDKNNNDRMDFESNGMPKEMYGVSNNIMSMGPPQWKDAKFKVDVQPLELEIRM